MGTGVDLMIAVAFFRQVAASCQALQPNQLNSHVSFFAPNEFFKPPPDAQEPGSGLKFEGRWKKPVDIT